LEIPTKLQSGKKDSKSRFSYFWHNKRHQTMKVVVGEKHSAIYCQFLLPTNSLIPLLLILASVGSKGHFSLESRHKTFAKHQQNCKLGLCPDLGSGTVSHVQMMGLKKTSLTKGGEIEDVWLTTMVGKLHRIIKIIIICFWD